MLYINEYILIFNTFVCDFFFSHQSIICLLILSGADVQLRSFSGHTAFDIATMSGKYCITLKHI